MKVDVVVGALLATALSPVFGHEGMFLVSQSRPRFWSESPLFWLRTSWGFLIKFRTGSHVDFYAMTCFHLTFTSYLSSP